LTKEFVE